VLRHLPAEMARELTLRGSREDWADFSSAPGDRSRNLPILAQRLWNLDFPNPVGFAAGFDKDARITDRLWDFGLGFVEVGTVTPRSQKGNPSPWLFWLDRTRRSLTAWGSRARGSMPWSRGSRRDAASLELWV